MLVEMYVFLSFYIYIFFYLQLCILDNETIYFNSTEYAWLRTQAWLENWQKTSSSGSQWMACLLVGVGTIQDTPFDVGGRGNYILHWDFLKYINNRTPKPQWAATHKGVSASFGPDQSLSLELRMLWLACVGGAWSWQLYQDKKKKKKCHHHLHLTLPLTCTVPPHLVHSFTPSIFSSFSILKY